MVGRTTSGRQNTMTKLERQETKEQIKINKQTNNKTK